MSISEHVEVFAGQPVREFTPEDGILDAADSAQRLAIEYDSEVSFADLFQRFLDDPAAGRVTALVIGSWDADIGSDSDSGPVVEALVAARDRLPGLRALFLGDITYDECEISWLAQTDVTPLLAAYPALEQLRVRGGTGLALGPIRHEGLRTLIIESGGLPAEVVRAVGAAELPNLEHLELWLGDEGYGGDASVDDLAPILSGGAFPRLKSLGLRNCAFADPLAVALADAPVMRRIEALDLSLGTLGDEGAVALVSSGSLTGLKRLDIHHHYVSDEVIDGLKALGIDLNADDRQDASETDGDRYVSVSE